MNIRRKLLGSRGTGGIKFGKAYDERSLRFFISTKNIRFCTEIVE